MSTDNSRKMMVTDTAAAPGCVESGGGGGFIRKEKGLSFTQS